MVIKSWQSKATPRVSTLRLLVVSEYQRSVCLLQNALTVVSPVIDVIDMDTFQYRASSPQLKGGEAGWPTFLICIAHSI